jgi:hypothetical protein
MEPANWQEENSRYLASAVAAIRTRLQKQAQAEPSAVVIQPKVSQEEPKSKRWPFTRKESVPAVTRQPALLAPTQEPAGPSAPATALTTAADRMTAPPALVVLTQRLGLSPFERDTLLLCAATELDTGIASLCARALGDPARPYPSFALALTILDEPSWEALSPERPLRYWRLIEINQPGGHPLTISALRADERIVSYLKGLNYLDDRLAPLVWPLEAGEHGDKPASQQHSENSIIAQLKRPPAPRKLPVIQLLGRDTPSKEIVSASVADSLGLRLYRLQVGLLPTQPADLEAFVRLWQRESLLLPAALYIETQTGEEVSRAQAIQVVLTRLNSLVFLDTREVWSGPGVSSVHVEVEKPTPAEQQAAWSAALGDAAGESPALLAGQFDLGLPTIREVAQGALPVAETGHLPDQLWDGCVAASRPRLDALAERIDPKATWEDIVLPAAEMKLLQQIADQVGKRSTVYENWGFREKTSRGLGISALFSGESGTGKTMAAEVLANHLRLNIHRIDLSAVVSKYIGETEKNLRRLFDAADNGSAVLFFDEADALFGKRSEVKDSHDRYANIEINYLLQRMEAYRGLAILATNMKSALDPAFLRRLRFIVTFPFPGAAERKLIWQRAFPWRTPLAGLDFDRLARLNITGGHIHNIALNAAFLAAHANSPVSMTMVLDAARTEFRKLERPINEADFRWQGAA